MPSDEVFNGIVPWTTWTERGAAEAQLSLLKSGYSIITENGGIKHVEAALERSAKR